MNKAGGEVSIRWRDSKPANIELPTSNVQRPKGCSKGVVQSGACVSKSSLEIGIWNLELRVRRAFTLIELMIVVGIISILAAMTLSALAAAKRTHQIAMAHLEMQGIEAALMSYQGAYGRYPTPTTSLNGDFTYGPSGIGSTVGTFTANNSELIAALMNLDQLSNAKHVLNPRNLSFFTPSTRARSTNDAGLGPDQVLRDPWGNPYVITIDYDYNGQCQDAVYSNAAVSSDPSNPTAGYKGLFRSAAGGSYQLAAPVMIWSLGPDGKASVSASAISGVNKDNVLSWSK